MSEFIINNEQLERLIEAIEHDTGREVNRLVIDGVRAAEIVRCRDCKHYGCYDGSTWCNRTYEQVPGGTCDYQTVEPDGYCAWGERREQ